MILSLLSLLGFNSEEESGASVSSGILVVAVVEGGEFEEEGKGVRVGLGVGLEIECGL